MTTAKWKKMVDDYDFIHRILNNESNGKKHNDGIIRTIELFLEKHKTQLVQPENHSMLVDLSTRLQQKFNNKKFN
jgi:hypothetical protein